MAKIGDYYRKFHGKIVSRPTNFGWIITDKLAGSGLPTTIDQVYWLINNNIKTIITIRELPIPDGWIKKINLNSNILDYYFLQVDDFNAPTIEEISKITEYIDKQIMNDKPVLVHCAAGKGRTGTILSAYLIKKNGMDPHSAISKIRSLRPGSIQSQRQELAINSFYNMINQKF